LTNGISYTFTVLATNRIGIGVQSLPSDAVTPYAACLTPGRLSHRFYGPSALTSGSNPSVPFAMEWAAVSGTSCRYELEAQDLNTGSWLPVYSGSGTSFRSRAVPGLFPAYRVRSVDLSGAPSPWSMAIMNTLEGVQEDAPTVTYGGSFTRRTGTTFWGGAMKSTTAGNTWASVTVQRQAVALIGTKCPTCGTLRVVVDGQLYATVNQYSATTQHRQVIFTYVPVKASQTIRLVNSATSRRPTMNIDGFVTFR
jgi:hypothetical protein